MSSRDIGDASARFGAFLTLIMGAANTWSSLPESGNRGTNGALRQVFAEPETRRARYCSKQYSSSSYPQAGTSLL